MRAIDTLDPRAEHRLPISVCSRHTAEWYRRARAFLIGLGLGFFAGLNVIWFLISIGRL